MDSAWFAGYFEKVQQLGTINTHVFSQLRNECGALTVVTHFQIDVLNQLDLYFNG